MKTRAQQAHIAAHNNAVMRMSRIEKGLSEEIAKLREQLAAIEALKREYIDALLAASARAEAAEAETVRAKHVAHAAATALIAAEKDRDVWHAKATIRAGAEEKLLDTEQARDFYIKAAEELRRLLDAAEAKLKALDEQELSPEEIRVDTFHSGVKGGFDTSIDTAVRITHLPTGVFTESSTERSQHSNKAKAVQLLKEKLYAAPIPPVDVQEYTEKDSLIQQQDIALEQKDKRIAELERKLAEQQSKVMRFEMQNGTSTYIEGFEELSTLLAKAREEGRKEAVPDGWQVVPKEPTDAMLIAGFDEFNTTNITDDALVRFYAGILAAAPKPEVKP